MNEIETMRGTRTAKVFEVGTGFEVGVGYEDADGFNLTRAHRSFKTLAGARRYARRMATR